MEKLLHERLREHAKGNSDWFECINEWTGKISPKTAGLLADEIEHYYIPKHLDENGEPWNEYDEAEVYSEVVSIQGYSSSGMFYETSDRLGYVWSSAKHFKRLDSKVFDADGVEIKVGDTVWFTNKNDAHLDWEVKEIVDGTIELERGTRSWSVNNPPEVLTHEKPVFDADGVRICKGDTVWHASTQWTVMGIVYLDGEPWVQLDNTGNNPKCSWQERKPSRITHQEPDSYEKLRDDMRGYADGGVSCIEDDMHMFADRLTAIIERGA